MAHLRTTQVQEEEKKNNGYVRKPCDSLHEARNEITLCISDSQGLKIVCVILSVSVSFCGLVCVRSHESGLVH